MNNDKKIYKKILKTILFICTDIPLLYILVLVAEAYIQGKDQFKNIVFIYVFFPFFYLCYIYQVMFIINLIKKIKNKKRVKIIICGIPLVIWSGFNLYLLSSMIINR